jgi:putative glutamine amidotransferase
MNPTHTPIIGIPCCVREVRERLAHLVVEKYVVAVTDAARGLPILIPALGDRLDIGDLARRLDGLLLTGSPSNVEPHHYGGEASQPGTLHDAQRDGMTLPLIRAALAEGVPVLAICRGIQELNVALGGTLHQRVHELPGRLNHRSPGGTMAERYAHTAHSVALTPGGSFERWAEGRREIAVNSLHSQGIDRPAPGLVIEAVAPDGQIEGVRVEGAGFAVGVQWHPEWQADENLFSRALFDAFGDACRARAARRYHGGAAAGRAA